MRRAACLALTAFALALGAPSAHALEGEVLLVTVPKGYKIGYEKKAGNQIMTEMVPEAQTVKDWSEMVTVQIFLNMRGVTPAQYRQRIQSAWSQACEGSTFSLVKEDGEGGYPTVTWLSECPHNNATGKPELTWMKAIEGRDSFYVVQKAYKFEPTAAQKTEWGAWLDSATVCDTRRPERNCGGAR
jgi:hypothetical protein